jgi:YaiO family outer membrane protein
MKRLNIAFVLLFLSIQIGIFAQSSQSAQNIEPIAKTVVDAEESDWQPKTEVQLQFSKEKLSKNFGTWETASIYAQKRLKSQQTVWAMYRVSKRRNIGDQEFIVGTYKPLRKKWAISAEAMYSPTTKFVGKFSVMGEVEKVVKRSYVLHAGTRFTAYNKINATAVYGLVERYWGSNRAAYTFSLTNLTNAGTSPSHRFQYNRYFGERVNNVGVMFGFGREHENLGPNIGILRTRTWSIAASAKYWINRKFGINLTASFHKQGEIYSRQGFNFGVNYRF